MFRVLKTLIIDFFAFGILATLACQQPAGLQIDSIDPSSAAPGDVVHLVGFGFEPARDVVTVGVLPADYAAETLDTVNLASQSEEPLIVDTVAIKIPENTPIGQTVVLVQNPDGYSSQMALMIVQEGESASSGTGNGTNLSGSAAQSYNFSATQFYANEPIVYKAPGDTSPKLVELGWNVGPTVPDKIVVSGQSWTAAKVGAQAQQGTRQVQISQTSSFKLEVVMNEQVVYEKTLDVPVQEYAANFNLNVDIQNLVTGEAGVTLTPQNNYQDSNQIKVIYQTVLPDGFDATGMEFCYSQPILPPTTKIEPGVQTKKLVAERQPVTESSLKFNLQKSTTTKVLKESVQVNDSLLPNKAPDSSVKPVALPAPQEMQTQIQCVSQLSGEIEFAMTGPMLFEYYLQQDGQQYLKNSQTLHYTILDPSFVKHELVSSGIFGTKMRLDYDYQDGMSFYIATNATNVLRASNPDAGKLQINKGESEESTGSVTPSGNTSTLSKATNISLLEMDKQSTCTIKDNVSNDTGPCADSGIRQAITDRFDDTDDDIFVFEFKQHSLAGAYYFKSNTYQTRVVALARGYQDEIFVSANAEMDFSEPDLSAFCQNKGEIFGAEGDAFAKFSNVQVHGLKYINLETQHCTAKGINECVPSDSGVAGSYRCDGSCEYDFTGDPGFILKGVDFLGNKVSKTCTKEFKKDLPISVEVDMVGDQITFNLGIDGHVPEISPYDNWRVIPYDGEVGGKLQECSVVSHPAKFGLDRADQKSIIENFNLNCYKFRLQVQRRGQETWDTLKVVKMSENEWASNYSGAGHVTFEVAPPLEFELDASATPTCIQNTSWDDDELEAISHDVVISGKNITDLQCSCVGIVQVTGPTLDLPADQLNGNVLTAEWCGGEEHGRDDALTWQCTCTAHGLNGQFINRTWNGCCEGDTWNDSGDKVCPGTGFPIGTNVDIGGEHHSCD